MCRPWRAPTITPEPVEPEGPCRFSIRTTALAARSTAASGGWAAVPRSRTRAATTRIMATSAFAVTSEDEEGAAVAPGPAEPGVVEVAQDVVAMADAGLHPAVDHVLGGPRPGADPLPAV